MFLGLTKISDFFLAYSKNFAIRARIYIIYSNSLLRILKFKLRIKASKRIVYILLHARGIVNVLKSISYNEKHKNNYYHETKDGSR